MEDAGRIAVSPDELLAGGDPSRHSARGVLGRGAKPPPGSAQGLANTGGAWPAWPCPQPRMPGLPRTRHREPGRWLGEVPAPWRPACVSPRSRRAQPRSFSPAGRAGMSRGSPMSATTARGGGAACVDAGRHRPREAPLRPGPAGASAGPLLQPPPSRRAAAGPAAARPHRHPGAVRGVRGVLCDGVAGGAEILAAAPDVVVLLPCGLDLARTRAVTAEVTRRPGFGQRPAARTGGVVAVDGSSYFSRPGPGILDGLELMAAIVRAKPGDPLPAGAAWVPLARSTSPAAGALCTH